MPNTPSDHLRELVAKLHAPTTVAEVDAHISSLTRELARYKDLLTNVLNHATQLEATIQALLGRDLHPAAEPPDPAGAILALNSSEDEPERVN